MQTKYDFEIELDIKSSEKKYNIFISDDFFNEYILRHLADGGFIICDKNVAKLYNIDKKEKVFIFDASEANKNFDYLKDILTFLHDNKARRDSVLLALGGGITGDITGFAAGIYMRGIKFIQMPTTFLSMVDSSVGGKTGINFNGIKNNVGAFNQPEAVYIDVNFLDTLSDSELLNGLAESIKVAAISSEELFYFIKNNKNAILKKDKNILKEVIYKSCFLKKEIVEKDEKEKNIRKLLNFGHTIGHAIETDSKNEISHGFAVALGMIYEMKFALKHKVADEKTYREIFDTIKDFGYETSYKIKNKEVFLNALAKDKKASANGISLALTGAHLKGKIKEGVLASELIEVFEMPN